MSIRPVTNKDWSVEWVKINRFNKGAKINSQWKTWLWRPPLTATLIEQRLKTIQNCTTEWLPHIPVSKKLRKKWVKKWDILTIWESCAEMWISIWTYYNTIKEHPNIAKQITEARVMKLATMKEWAEAAISKAILWDAKMSDKESTDVAKWFLEKTTQEYNPKTQIEQVSVEIDLSEDMESIKERMRKYNL